MKKINEIFYSIQGEGFNVGTPAIFIRFAKCNLKCSFCDTEYDDGTMMTDEEIVKQVRTYPAELIIITGGEPGLSLDYDLVQALKNAGKRIAVETNGTKELPCNVDWVTISPKDLFCKGADLVLKNADEVKVVYVNKEQDISKYPNLIKADHYYVQPCATGNQEVDVKIVKDAVDYVLKNPLWHLSIQMHKIINIQ